MRKAIAIVIQIIILTAAVFVMTNTIEDNTYFGLIYGDIVENIRWIMLGAMVLSGLNIWLLWPRKVVNTPAQTSTKEVTKSVETEEVKTDPIVPKMD